jgi:hypothetical protein
VDLVEVDVVGPQPAQRVVDAGQDVFAGEPAVVGARAHREEDLGGQHVVVAAAERLGEQPSGDLLGQAVRVGVGGVEEGHAGLHRPPHDRLGLALAQMPPAFGLGAVAHHPKGDPGDLQTGRAQSRVLHSASSGSGITVESFIRWDLVERDAGDDQRDPE